MAASGDILRVAARASIGAIGDFVNVYHLDIIGGSNISDATATSAIGVWLETLYTPLLGMFSDSMTFQDYNIFNNTSSEPIGSFPWPTLVGGSQSGDMMPPTLAAFVRATTGLSRNWARKFIWPMSESQNTGLGFIASTAMTALGSFGAAWLANAVQGTDITLRPVVFHALTGTYNPITEIIVRNVWANMRTRRPGRGS